MNFVDDFIVGNATEANAAGTQLVYPMPPATLPAYSVGVVDTATRTFVTANANLTVAATGQFSNPIQIVSYKQFPQPYRQLPNPAPDAWNLSRTIYPRSVTRLIGRPAQPANPKIVEFIPKPVGVALATYGVDYPVDPAFSYGLKITDRTDRGEMEQIMLTNRTYVVRPNGAGMTWGEVIAQICTQINLDPAINVVAFPFVATNVGRNHLPYNSVLGDSIRLIGAYKIINNGVLVQAFYDTTFKFEVSYISDDDFANKDPNLTPYLVIPNVYPLAPPDLNQANHTPLNYGQGQPVFPIWYQAGSGHGTLMQVREMERLNIGTEGNLYPFRQISERHANNYMSIVDALEVLEPDRNPLFDTIMIEHFHPKGVEFVAKEPHPIRTTLQLLVCKAIGVNINGGNPLPIDLGASYLPGDVYDAGTGPGLDPTNPWPALTRYNPLYHVNWIDDAVAIQVNGILDQAAIDAADMAITGTPADFLGNFLGGNILGSPPINQLINYQLGGLYNGQSDCDNYVTALPLANGVSPTPAQLFARIANWAGLASHVPGYAHGVMQ